jgi:glycerophosphoryl diester phosphodiesterase
MKCSLGWMFALATAGSVLAGEGPLVIAHRGASGYLPEHTLEAAAYAHALGADYIEQDVVLSRDGVLVVLHDLYLDAVTDVAKRFASRARADGRHYVIDFTWEELRTLRVRERVGPVTGRPVFPQRFPDNSASFRLCRFDEQLRLIQGLNHSTGRNAGVYVELKDPAFHEREGKDLGVAVLKVLAEYGYVAGDANAFVQCFDAAALRRLRTELKTPLPLVVLLEAGDAGHLTPEGLREIARYARGIGPPLSLVLKPGKGGQAEATPLVAAAHEAGLVVHPYTFRADSLPSGIPDVRSLLSAALRAGIDGFFIDQPDIGREVVEAAGAGTAKRY